MTLWHKVVHVFPNHRQTSSPHSSTPPLPHSPIPIHATPSIGQTTPTMASAAAAASAPGVLDDLQEALQSDDPHAIRRAASRAAVFLQETMAGAGGAGGAATGRTTAITVRPTPLASQSWARLHTGSASPLPVSARMHGKRLLALLCGVVTLPATAASPHWWSSILDTPTLAALCGPAMREGFEVNIRALALRGHGMYRDTRALTTREYFALERLVGAEPCSPWCALSLAELLYLCSVVRNASALTGNPCAELLAFMYAQPSVRTRSTHLLQHLRALHRSRRATAATDPLETAMRHAGRLCVEFAHFVKRQEEEAQAAWDIGHMQRAVVHGSNLMSPTPKKSDDMDSHARFLRGVASRSRAGWAQLARSVAPTQLQAFLHNTTPITTPATTPETLGLRDMPLERLHVLWVAALVVDNNVVGGRAKRFLFGDSHSGPRAPSTWLVGHLMHCCVVCNYKQLEETARALQPQDLLQLSLADGKALAVGSQSATAAVWTFLLLWVTLRDDTTALRTLLARRAVRGALVAVAAAARAVALPGRAASARQPMAELRTWFGMRGAKACAELVVTFC